MRGVFSLSSYEEDIFNKQYDPSVLSLECFTDELFFSDGVS